MLYNRAIIFYNKDKYEYSEDVALKKKMLIIGITMAAAGSEKSFLSFAKTAIDYEKYEVDLLLAKKTGDFLSEIPKEIRVLEMDAGGDIFLIDKNNATSIIMREHLLKNPLRAFSFLPYYIAVKKAKDEPVRTYAAHRLWLHVMSSMKSMDAEYDVALAFWGDRTMFYMIDKVRAKKKIAWLHFDYDHPPRENAVYLPYFDQCDKVVTVSTEIGDSLKKALPSIAKKVVTVENIIVREDILKKAAAPVALDWDFDGKRIVTVGRICPQKGYDLALPAMAKLKKEGYSFRWYIIGRGDGAYFDDFRAEIERLGLSNEVVLLGVQQNPYAFMARADIYMQPSRHEGKPIAVEEAKVLCVPILTTNFTSAAEQLEEGRLGVITEISSKGIYEGLRKILADESICAALRRELVSFGKNAQKSFDADTLL